MSALAVARLVRRDLVRRPLHLGIALVAAALIVTGHALASFGFGRESSLVIVSGMETIATYAFATVLLLGAGAVGRDLEGRLLVSILARPVSRGAYLAGRLLGLVETCAAGVVPLVGILVLVLALGGASEDRVLDAARLTSIASGAVLALAQAAALAAAVLLVSTLVPPSLGLVVGLVIAGCGLLAEPVRQALATDAALPVRVLARVLSLLAPPIGHPAEGSEVAFGQTPPIPLILVGIARSTLYAIAALGVATWRLGRKDLT